MDTLFKYLVYTVAVLAVLALLLGMAILLKRRKKATGNTSRDDDDEGWSAENKQYLWSILLVLGGGGAVLWGVYHPVRLADAVQWRGFWFSLLVLWAVGATLIAINAKGVLAKTLQWVLAGAIFMLFIGLPLVRGEKPPPPAQVQQQREPDCTSSTPCTPTLGAGGSTEVVQGKPGFGICFDSSYWVNLSRLRYHITYGGIEKKYECTREDVLAGKCSQTLFDAFRFVPEAGVSLPKYWFATKGTNC